MFTSCSRSQDVRRHRPEANGTELTKLVARVRSAADSEQTCQNSQVKRSLDRLVRNAVAERRNRIRLPWRWGRPHPLSETAGTALSGSS